MPDIRLYGIRHHGPGSARALCSALAAFAPDCVLIEGPSDACDLIPLASDPAMIPPVALLVYRPDDTSRAGFYPFAEFSPEWQAMAHAAAAGAECRFIDLPQAVELASGPDAGGDVGARRDPLGELAAAAGHEDGERWWDEMVENRIGGGDAFDAVAEAMEAVREGEAPQGGRDEAREAHMRSGIRDAAREGFARIAVVCGAFHVPALARHGEKGMASRDAAALRGLPRARTAAAWVPWSYERLAAAGGYAAGVESPEFYHAVWEHGDRLAARWLATAARLMRDADLDASPASVIEAVRLAEGLAGMRGRARPILADLDEAALGALCGGEEAPMALVRRRLSVGERIGSVPEGAPTTPLQADFAAQAKRLRMPPEGGDRVIELDLRKEIDLARSRLLHRTALLGAAWGSKRGGRNGKGTFREAWDLSWKPEFLLELVNASRRGSTVEEAASAMARERAGAAAGIADLAALVGEVLDAELPSAAADVTRALSDRSALATDVFDLMEALPPLSALARYGSVRSRDADMIRVVLGGIVPRAAAGLAGGCASLDDEAAARAGALLSSSQNAISLLEDPGLSGIWMAAVSALSDQASVHGRVSGRAARIMFDAGRIDAGEAGIRLRRALSDRSDAAGPAAWAEGFLESSGAVLVHGSAMLPVVDEWLTGLDPERFVEVLPVLRRTFSAFSKPERHDIGDRIRLGAAPSAGTSSATPATPAAAARAAMAYPVLRALLEEAA